MSWCFFFFNHKTAYEMRISDWMSDVCSSDLVLRVTGRQRLAVQGAHQRLGLLPCQGQDQVIVGPEIQQQSDAIGLVAEVFDVLLRIGVDLAEQIGRAS